MDSGLHVKLIDKFAFLPKRVMDRNGNFVRIWMKKYTEVLVIGEMVWIEREGYRAYEPSTISHGEYLYNVGHSKVLHEEIIDRVMEKENAVEMLRNEIKKQVVGMKKPYEKVIISVGYYKELCDEKKTDPHTIYSVQKRVGPRQILYTNSEGAMYHIADTEPEDLILVKVKDGMYKVFEVDMTTSRDRLPLHVTYQYISDGTRDSIIL